MMLRRTVTRPQAALPTIRNVRDFLVEFFWGGRGSRGSSRTGLALLPCLLLALSLPSRASAQCAPTDVLCKVSQPPVVWTEPGDITWSGTTQTAQLTVTIHWCGPYSGLNLASRTIYFDTDSVTGSFSPPASAPPPGGTQHCLQHATSVGTLTLTSGSHQLHASIARLDDAEVTGQATTSYTYTYAPPPPPPEYRVQVSPHSGTVGRPAGSRATEVFQVLNQSNVPTTFAIAPLCSGSGLSGSCSLSVSTITLAPGESRTVGVNYRASTSTPLTAAIGVRASGGGVADSGSVQMTTGVAGQSGWVGAIQANGILRSDCLTVAAAEAAALECGDLRLVHALPSTRVMNHTFTPVLIYNSSQAHPLPVIQHRYSPPPGATPTTISMSFCRQANGTWSCPATSSFPGWAPGTTRRIGVAWDASTSPTASYPDSIRITSHYADGTSQATIIAGMRLPVVNRGGIAQPNLWGNGWSLAGLEQLLFQADGSILWLAGDGSTQIYNRIDAYTFYATPYDRPDTLRVVNGEYVRTLPGRAEVHFNGMGRHLYTVNKLGQRTDFEWIGNQLTFIYLPNGLAYQFSYNGCMGQLSCVKAPGGRVTNVATDCSGRITSITNPGLAPVSFGYSDATTRITSRTDRRGFRTDFRYDAAFRLAAVKRWMNQAATGDSIVMRFRPQESQTLLATGGSVLESALYTRIDGPRIDAPDTTKIVLGRWGSPNSVTDALGNTTSVWREDTRWPGLVTRVVSPNGREMSATYDARGHAVASVDWGTVSAGGNQATTIVDWDPVWDAPTRVVQPMGEVTLTAYDSLGRTAWVQPGPDSTRRTRFTYLPGYDWYAWGMVESVKAPLTNPERYTYDEQGNLSTVTAPTGLVTTTYSNLVGRVDSVTAPGGATKRFTYDAADQVIEEESVGPARPAHSSFAADSIYSEEHLWVHTYRNANGQPDSVARWQSPDPANIDTIITRWKYDSAGRAIVEIAPDATPATADNPRDSTVYDPAGNPTDVFTRRGFHFVMRYDTLGRLARRITPAATATINPTVITWARPTTVYFPYFGQDAQGNFTVGPASQTRTVTIPTDTAVFGYDAMGNLLWANNRDARISRVWNPNGTLAAETQRIRSYAGNDTLTHAYRLDFQYDLAGRRTALIHPGNISPDAPARSVTSYAYDPVTGDLASISGQGGYAFTHDLAGRTALLTRGSTHETFTFDLGGRMYNRQDWSGNTRVHSDVTTFDGTTGEVTRVDALRETVLQARRGLGALAWVDTYDRVKGTRNVEYYGTDPLTNQRSSQLEAYGTTQAAPALDQPEAVVHAYERYTGRLLSTANAQSPGPYEFSWYDVAGNQTFRGSIQTVGTPYTGLASGGGTTSSVAAPLRDETAMYYGADDRLRVADRRSCLLFIDASSNQTCDPARAPAYEKRSAFEEYRYDALGRRVLVRTRSEFACTQLCLNTLRRTVWDGDQLLYEISAPGGSAATAAQMEADTGLAAPLFTGNNGTAVNVFFPYGRILYEHGGLDAPLGVVRMEYSDTLRKAQVILPHANWRGSYDRGTTLGHCFVYGTNGTMVAPPPDSTPTGGDGTRPIGGTWGGSAEHCINVDWPAAYTWSARQYRRGYSGPVSWMGSLIFENRDASGLYYRRNRYYDSEKGRFTQEDPIGLAGGINMYGFANGDPVQYSDPYGLSSNTCPPSCHLSPNEASPPPITLHDVREWINSHGVDVLFLGAGILERSEGNVLRRFLGRGAAEAEGYVARDFASPALLERHFADHAAEWGAGNVTRGGYLTRARQLLQSPIGRDIEGFTRVNGDVVKYNIRTNEFAVGTKDGTIRTLFRPKEGAQYYLNALANK